MSFLQNVCRCIIAIALIGMASISLAHREPGSLTTIKWNNVTGRTEIIHRLHTHDAELGVGSSLDIPELSVMDVEGRAHIALYIEERFHIKTSDGGELQLELIGAEVSGNYILVYQESPVPLAGNILVRDDILHDVIPAQLNQVNIEDGDSVYSLVFANDDGWLGYKFLQ